MAAFEAVSRLQLSTVEGDETIDFRYVELPFEAPKEDPEFRFDPRDHLKTKTPIPVWMAHLNIIRLSFGAGMLAIPLAIANAGVLFGTLMIISIGFVFLHTHTLLLWCKNEICRQLRIPHITYRYGFRVALMHGPPAFHFLGTYGACIVGVFMILSQVGICTLFVIFTSDNLRDMMDWESNAPALLVLFIPYILMELYMKNFKRVSQVAMFGTGLNVLALLLVLWEMIHGPGEEFNIMPNGFLQILFAGGIMYFNMSALAVCLQCERNLADPKKMTEGRYAVIKVGFLVPTAISCVFGILGHKAFGGMEENALRYLPYDSEVTQTAFAVYLVSVALGYPVQCYPATHLMLDMVKNHDPLVVPSEQHLKALEYILRPLFVVLTFIIAYLVPFQGPFVAFVGNLSTTMLALVFPALMEIGIRYPNKFGKYCYILCKDILIIILGLMSWVFGVMLCSQLIYIRLQAKDETAH